MLIVNEVLIDVAQIKFKTLYMTLNKLKLSENLIELKRYFLASIQYCN